MGNCFTISIWKGGEPMPLKEFTPEERRENGRKGGIASGIAKRRKAEMKKTLETLLTMPLNGKKCYEVDEIQNFAQLKPRTRQCRLARVCRRHR